MTLAIVIPAAGASSRMGGADKLMQIVDGQPLLVRQVARAMATGAPVFVTTRADRPARAAALARIGAATVPVADPDTGLSASLRAGIAALPRGTGAALILLPDLPDITEDDLRRMIAAHRAAPDSILRATGADGTPGHPTVFPARVFADLMRVTGDRGAQSVLAQAGFSPVALPGNRALTDLDTPEDWAAWRAAQAEKH